MMVLGFSLLAGGCHKVELGLCRMRLPESHVQIDTETPSYSLEASADARSLGDAHRSDGEMITYGLTSARSKVSAEVALHVMRVPGGVCARPDLTLHLAYSPMRVQIARELPRHSCGYEAVLGHEMKHVEVFRQQLTETASTLRNEIDARDLKRVVIYPDAEHAETAMQELQDRWLVPRAEALLGQVEALQHGVDSPAEYQRVASACPDTPLLSGQAGPEALHF